MPQEMNTAHLVRILVVDDSTANLQLLTNLLTEHGYTVHPASDGELALEFTRSVLPDLILLDIRMPGMDGFEVCRRLKADERTRSIPIIFISILEDERDKVKGFLEGAVDYVTKPFQPEEVLARVRTHLRLRELTEHLEQKVAERTEELMIVTERLQRELAERKKVQEALRVSEEKYRRIVDTANEGILVRDPDDVTTFVNARMAKMLGYSAEEMIGRPLADFMFEEDAPDHSQKIEARRKGISSNYERRFRRKDGETVWTLTAATPVFDDKHNFVGSFAMCADITERKRAEQERLAHLRFFECMDQIDRAIQGTTNLDQVMSEVLARVRSIFKSDRVFLLYPCNPSAPTFRVLAEVCQPEYPGAYALNMEIPVTTTQAETFGRVLESEIPVVMRSDDFQTLRAETPVFDDGGFVIPQSALIMALRPKTGDAWMFGLQQCSDPRVWTPEEERFFQEIGRRLGDALTTGLMYRFLQESEQRFRMVFEDSPVSIWEEDFSGVKTLFDDLKKKGIADLEAYFNQYPETVRRCADLVKIVNVNRATLAMHAASNKEELQAGLAHTFTPESYDAFRQELVCLWNGETEKSLDAIVKTLAGEPRNVTVYYSVCPGYEETLSKVLVSLTDITTRKQAEYALFRSERQKELILNSTAEMVTYYDTDLRVIWGNRAWVESVGKSPEELVGRHCHEAWYQRGEPCADCPVLEARDNKAPRQREMDTPLGRHRLVRAFPIIDENSQVTALVGFVQDITERKRAEQEKEKLQEQFLQAQKMESVGRLAGGVAHDFNNLLGVILGNADISLRSVDQAHPLFGHLQEIRKAAKRSADLTRQLLAFARKQTIAPKVLDLNETVEGTLNLLRRLIGEDINLVWKPGAKLWPVKVDPSQMDQILANLCVNARDAIAGVGRITIQTENAVFDEIYCADHPDTAPGEYVLIAVSDDGCGMDRETLNRLFEPFFTTKELGKGTGLGLATVYGIVRQNSGFINVYSELEHGTTIKIYLPRHAAKTERIRKESPAIQTARGHETILLVEDESMFLNVVKLMLEGFGYRVLAASTPREAIRVSGEHLGEIHLLLTDVVMPEMTGRDLVKHLTSLRPGLKQLFMSGYTGDIIAHHGVLDEGVNFIQKPFSTQALASKVREVLDSMNS
ncbi:MAG: PAS domain S-box protein [Thermodesulfobacteriota bacterium]